MVGPQAQRNVVNYLCEQHSLSERRACGLAKANRTTCRYQSKVECDVIEKRLKELAGKHLAFGYRRLHALLKREGHEINHKRVYRLYKKNHLVKRRRKRKRYPVRYRRPLEKVMKPNQRWAMDFMSDSCGNGSKLRTLNIVDIFARECLGIVVGSSLPSSKVIETLEMLASERGLPEAITLDNGPEYTSKIIQQWAEEKGVHFDYITPGRPMENGYVESFNGRFREECLNQNWFRNLGEALIIIEDWREDYNTKRPHSALGYLTPKEFLQKFEAVHMFTNRSRTNEQLSARPFISSQTGCELMNNLAEEEENLITTNKVEKVYL